MFSIREKITLPVLQNMIASVLGAGTVTAYVILSTALTPCTASIKSDVMRGEHMLLSGDFKAADRIADDAITIAPHCGCAQLFRASVSSALLTAAKSHGDLVMIERYRKECFVSAARAADKYSDDPRVEAILEYCRA